MDAVVAAAALVRVVAMVSANLLLGASATECPNGGIQSASSSPAWPPCGVTSCSLVERFNPSAIAAEMTLAGNISNFARGITPPQRFILLLIISDGTDHNSVFQELNSTLVTQSHISAVLHFTQEPGILSEMLENCIAVLWNYIYQGRILLTTRSPYLHIQFQRNTSTGPDMIFISAILSHYKNIPVDGYLITTESNTTYKPAFLKTIRKPLSDYKGQWCATVVSRNPKVVLAKPSALVHIMMGLRNLQKVHDLTHITVLHEIAYLKCPYGNDIRKKMLV